MGTELERTETKAERGGFRVDRGGDRPVREAQIADGQFDGCAGAGVFNGCEMRAGKSLLCRRVQQDGVVLLLRQQRPLGQTPDGHDSDDLRAMGIDAFRFKRHAACSFGDVPVEQKGAACRLTVSSTTMIDSDRTQNSAKHDHCCL